MEPGTENPPFDRPAWSRFVRALKPLIRSFYQGRSSTARAEAEVFDRFECMHYVVRSYESSPTDGMIVAYPEGVEGLPDAQASYQELWGWATGRDDVICITFDVKLVQPTASNHPSSDYSFSESSPLVEGSHVRFEPDFYVVAFEGTEDFAIVPSATWLNSTERSYGIEPLVNGMPAWYQPFVVHPHHAARALRSLCQAQQNPGVWYRNPTTGVRLKGWEVKGTTKPPILPTLKQQDWSYQSYLRISKAIESEGGKCDFNHVAPHFFDLRASLEGTGLLDWELKFTHYPVSEMRFKTDIRRSPFTKRRVWHVLLCECSDGMMCIMRNEVDYDWAKRTQPWSTDPDGGREFLEMHVFDSMAGVVEYVRRHAQSAKDTVAAVIADITPHEIDEGLRKAHMRDSLLSVGNGDVGDDPLTGLQDVQLSLPWLSGIINESCRKAGYGLCLALNPRHPWGDHIFVDYKWTQQEQNTNTGALPHRVSSSKLRRKRCLVLRHAHLNASVGSKPGALLTMRRRFWRRPMRKGHFIMLGGILDRSIAEKASRRSSWYLLLPSQFTSMWAPRRFLHKAPLAARAKGAHVFPTRCGADLDLPNGPREGAPSKTFDSDLLVKTNPSIDINRHILNAADGTIYHELCKILNADSSVSIANPQSAQHNPEFDPKENQTTVEDVLQAQWDYGCPKQHHPKPTTGNQEHDGSRPQRSVVPKRKRRIGRLS